MDPSLASLMTCRGLRLSTTLLSVSDACMRKLLIQPLVRGDEIIGVKTIPVQTHDACNIIIT